MSHARVGVPSGNKVSTYQENRENAKVKFTDTSFMSKGELRRTVESLDYEVARSIQIKEENLKLLQENIKLQREALSNGRVINDLKRKVIDLYAQINKDKAISPLMIAG